MRIDSEIDEAVSYWDETEVILKQAENVSQLMIVPAVSELRYGGRKFIDYIRSIEKGDSKKAREHLEDFKQCCIRARHDALDALVSYLILYIRNLENGVGTERIVEFFPNLDQLKANVADASKLVVDSRGNRENRLEIYTEVNARFTNCLFSDYWELDKVKPKIFRSSRYRNFQKKGLYAILSISAALFGFSILFFVAALLIVRTG